MCWRLDLLDVENAECRVSWIFEMKELRNKG